MDPRPAALCLAALLAAGLPAAAGAQGTADPGADLQRLEGEIDEARRRQAELDARAAEVATELEVLRQRSIEAAGKIVVQQIALGDLETRLLELETDVAAREQSLTEKRERVARLIGGLTRLARTPAEAMIVRPERPVDALRASRLLRAAIPAIEDEAEALRAELQDLARRRADLLSQRDAAEAARRQLNADIATLGGIMEEREALLGRTEPEREAEARRAAALAAEASGIRDLIERLEAERRRAEAEEARRLAAQAEEARRRAAEEAARREAEARAAAERRIAALPPAALVEGVLMPANGEIVLRYGQRDRFGTASRGLTLRARPATPIVAPLDGTVRFAGEFRGYGRILILEHAGGYHSMISGLGRIDAEVGQQVLSGEPLGSVPQNEQDQPSLIYFEFRRNGQPINPIDGLTQARERGRG